jgi:hypothetical protein
MVDALKKLPTLFVSHSGNSEFVQALRDDLPHFDFLVSDWKDNAGEIVAAKVQNDVAKADVVIVVLAGTAIHSSWVQTRDRLFARAWAASVARFRAITGHERIARIASRLGVGTL